MTTYVLYVPENRELDLAHLSEPDYQLVASLRSQISKGDRILLCQQPAVPGHDEMYVRQSCGKYFACHFPGGGHGDHEISRESDEHKRQKEYWHRAGDDAGYRSDIEFRTGSGSILDVAIHGPAATGIEIQRSRITLSTAHRRTKRSFSAGWLSLWFTAADNAPGWLYKVPSVGCNHIPWDNLPPRGHAVATGLRRVQIAKCTPHDFGKCPNNQRRHCGADHPKLDTSWTGLTLDDVAGLVPAGEAVPLVTLKQDVYLVPSADLPIYESLIGRPSRYSPEISSDAGPNCTNPANCHNPNHLKKLVKSCGCGNGILWPRPGRILCERCDPIMRLPISPYPI